MKLNAEQEIRVFEFVDGRGIKLKSLRDDVIDHLCCVLEYELGRGKSFEQSLEKAAKDLAPDGLDSIERETVFLLNAKRIIIMKKLIYSIGFLGAALLTVGVTFKLLHLPGANLTFMIGFLGLLLIFVPLLAIDRYKVAISKALSERFKIILGTISGVTVGISGLFKILHLQGTEVLLMMGTLIFVVGFLPFFFFTMYKKSIS